MCKRQTVRYIAVFAAVLTTLTMPALEAQARAWSWAKRLPVNHYSPEDIEIVKQTMSETLEHGVDGQAGDWSNADTGHSGSITPLSTTEQDGKRCRHTRFSSFTQEGEHVSEFYLCKQPDGRWAVEQPGNQ